MGKKAGKMIRMAVLGSSLAATPAANAEAREMWPMPPIPPENGMQLAREQFKAIENHTKNVMDEAARTMDRVRGEFKEVEERARRDTERDMQDPEFLKKFGIIQPPEDK